MPNFRPKFLDYYYTHKGALQKEFEALRIARGTESDVPYYTKAEFKQMMERSLQAYENKYKFFGIDFRIGQHDSRQQNIDDIKIILNQLDENPDEALTAQQFDDIQLQVQGVFHEQKRGALGRSTLEDFVSAAMDWTKEALVGPSIIQAANNSAQAEINCRQRALWRLKKDIYAQFASEENRNRHYADCQKDLLAPGKDPTEYSFAGKVFGEKFEAYLQDERKKYTNFLPSESTHEESIETVLDGELVKRTFLYNKWVPDDPENAKGVIVALHGWCDSSDMWRAYAEQKVKEGYIVYAYDQRPFGYTDERFARNAGGSPAIDQDVLTDDFKIFCDLVQRENPALPLNFAGHSMGSDVLLLSKDFIQAEHPGAEVDLFNPAVLDPNHLAKDKGPNLLMQLASGIGLATPTYREGENNVLNAEQANKRFDSSWWTKIRTLRFLTKIMGAATHSLTEIKADDPHYDKWTMHVGLKDMAVPMAFINKLRGHGIKVEEHTAGHDLPKGRIVGGLFKERLQEFKDRILGNKQETPEAGNEAERKTSQP